MILYSSVISDKDLLFTASTVVFMCLKDETFHTPVLKSTYVLTSFLAANLVKHSDLYTWRFVGMSFRDFFVQVSFWLSFIFWVIFSGRVPVSVTFFVLDVRCLSLNVVILICGHIILSNLILVHIRWYTIVRWIFQSSYFGCIRI